MTKSQISKKLGVPLSTIKDWSREGDRKHDLYLFLSKVQPEEFAAISKRPVTAKKKSEPKYHRLLHIINRNISNTYTLIEIKHAFNDVDYDNKSIDDQLIIESFFKECDGNDYKKLLQFNGITKEHVKSAYSKSPSSRSPYHDYWNKILHISQKEKPVHHTVNTAKKTSGMLAIEKMRGLHA